MAGLETSFNAFGYTFTSLWHCFGNQRNLCPLPVASDLLKISGTNVLPINTHNLSKASGRNGLELGYAGVTYDTFAQHVDVSKYHRMLNINLQTTAKAAVDKTLMAFDLTGERLIKLEVLRSDNIDNSDQDGLVEAAATLRRSREELIVLPLCANDIDVAKRLIDLGCPLLRIMGSPIASRAGIGDPQMLERICALGTPVVVDGGIGTADHALQAIRLGARGCLINSMLFAGDAAPTDVMRCFVSELHAQAGQAPR